MKKLGLQSQPDTINNVNMLTITTEARQSGCCVQSYQITLQKNQTFCNWEISALQLPIAEVQFSRDFVIHRPCSLVLICSSLPSLHWDSTRGLTGGLPKIHHVYFTDWWKGLLEWRSIVGLSSLNCYLSFSLWPLKILDFLIICSHLSLCLSNMFFVCLGNLCYIFLGLDHLQLCLPA